MKATTKAGRPALLFFCCAVLLAGGTDPVHGQSALDGFDPNVNAPVRVVVVQPDGKILIGGDFTTLSPNGGRSVTRNRIARLNANGTVDETFDPNANGNSESNVRSIALQTDGKIIVGGDFTSIGGQARNCIARLDPTTGVADSFDPNVTNLWPPYYVNSIVAQADGKIVIGGLFRRISPNGGGMVTRQNIARLNPDGTLDTFDPNSTNAVFAIALDAEGRIVVGGAFDYIGGQQRHRIARLDASTGLADFFNPDAGATGYIYAIALQTDNKVLAGGFFSSIGGQTRYNMARLDPTTGLADSFDPNPNSYVFALGLQADGKVLVGGEFNRIGLGGPTRHNLARLDGATGSPDSFDPNANAWVNAIAVQGDGNIVIGGQFTMLAPDDGDAVTRNHIARLISVTPTPAPSATPCVGWTEQAPYPIAISGHAVASQGGNVYGFGGIESTSGAIANAYKYTPATNTWTPIAFLPAPRGWFSAASDGTYIYLLGGINQDYEGTATLWRYDPANNTYDMSLPAYTIPTFSHASVYLNGRIYRIGGWDMENNDHVEVYDIASNTWSMAANYPIAISSLMVVAIGDYVYAAGGNKTYRYDSSTNTWDDAAIADLPAGRLAAASGAYNGKWIIAGGYVNSVATKTVIAWDPITNTWNNLPHMVQARHSFQGATAGESFYAVAGHAASGLPTNDNQQYTETPCATATPIPTPINISGTISNCSNPVPGPVPNVTLTLTGNASGSMLSDGSGNYQFSSLPSGGSYTVTPSKAAIPAGSTGIDTLDVVAAQRHFLIIGTPLTGCRLTAADVNGDSAVNTIDVIAIQRFFLILPTGTANVGQYQFNPTSRSYAGIVSDQTAQNYDTLIFGDVASPFVDP